MPERLDRTTADSDDDDGYDAAYEAAYDAELEAQGDPSVQRRQVPATARRSGCADLITGVFVLLTILVVVLTIIWVSYPALSPFPRPTPIVVLVIATDRPTAMPTLTFTPAPPTATLATATPTATPTTTATPIPTITSTPVFSGNTAAPALVTTEAVIVQWTRSPRPFTATVIFQQNQTSRGCQWQSIAGQALDLAGKPIKGLAARFISTDGAIDEFHYSGQEPRFGESGFEAILGDTPREATYTVQLLGRNGEPVSEAIVITTRATCEENVGVVVFQQNHSY